ncbi:MAG: hypothetical protein KDA80_07170 [Planctomycetaceae bacterium]|nr:hypothetical protein [Planctomycetaceae bacterium]
MSQSSDVPTQEELDRMERQVELQERYVTALERSRELTESGAAPSEEYMERVEQHVCNVEKLEDLPSVDQEEFERTDKHVANLQSIG